ncbi:glycosyltransferase [Luteimonas sp. A277]
MNLEVREATPPQQERTPPLPTPAPTPPSAPGPARGLYVPLPVKFWLALAIALTWTGLSIWLSRPWLNDLAELIGLTAAIVIITFIAYVPGFMNGFLIASTLMDRRPPRRKPAQYPPVTILVACYNEQEGIAATIQSLAEQEYPGDMTVLVMDDGSTDDSVATAEAAIAFSPARPGRRFQVVRGGKNVGKAGVLNRGLALTHDELVVTVDGDCWVYRGALSNLVERYLTDPPDTRAVAGSVLARNSRENWLTRIQEWDYFHGIAAVKRMQSMYHGTLVAQGAFSLYDRSALEEVGGWPECVGEDIVLSWALLERGYRIGHGEDAVAFTTVPDTLGQFARQRRRWSRGLIEAFRNHPRLLVSPRLSMLFIWWNVLFLPLDLVYTLVFIPGIIAALFGHYHIVGIMTLLVLPLALLWNVVIFRVQRQVFLRQGLRIRRNIAGFLAYVFGYSLILQPVCVWGYVSELVGLRKDWGTK